MICRKCANMFDDSLSSCPECGTPIFDEGGEEKQEKSKETFVLDIPEEEMEKPVIIKASSEEELEHDFEQVQNKEEKEAQPEIVRRVKNVSSSNDKAHNEKSRQQEKEAEKDTVGDRSAAALIVSMVCILACMMTVLTFVSIKSDVFKGDGEVVKTVAMSSLSGEQKGEIEQWLSLVGIVCEEGINPSASGVNSLLKLMKPYDARGIYRSVYGDAEITANTPDPAHRYANENGDYSYYKIEEEKIDALAISFGYTANHTVNADDFYYYDGYYYFKNKDAEKTAEYIVDVKNSNRIQDGSYYIECSFVQKNEPSAPSVERYAIVQKNDDGNEFKWKIKKLSDSPIFDESGIIITGDVSFKMQTEIIEKKAKDGTVYHRYVVEYPLFSGSSLGEQTANQLFSDMINVYKAEGEKVQKDYQHYVENGGVKDELPLLTHIVSRVTYTENGYISLIEDTAEYVPQSMPSANADEQENDGEEAETAEQADAPAALAKRTVEGYNLDVESGDFVTKDAIIGKDYQTISALLYRIYNGYAYDDIKAQLAEKTDEALNGDENEAENESVPAFDGGDMEEIPEDEDGLGMKIYESASALTKDGYMFCFVTEDGCAQDVVLPFDVEGLYTEIFA